MSKSSFTALAGGAVDIFQRAVGGPNLRAAQLADTILAPSEDSYVRPRRNVLRSNHHGRYNR